MIVSRTSSYLTYAVLTVFAFLSVYPLVGLLAVALEKPGSLVGGVPLFPESFHVSNFSLVWSQAHLGAAFVNSGKISLLTVTFTILCSVTAGYAFGTMRFRGDKLIFGVLLLGLMVPTEAVIIPLYYDLRATPIADTIWAVVLPQTAAGIAFGTFWMRTFFAAAPRELTEAALVDGAARAKVLWKVLLPLARPAIQTLALLVFLSSFNDFLLPLIMLQNPSIQTVPLSVAAFQGPRVTDQTGVAAVALLACLPVVAVYLVLQRRLIEGLTAGAVKG
jgi:raffinose/stachyose/melibiose transport system permease protein